MIIAIDGPAASGKGTLARKLAAHYELKHLDTGLLYRAVGHRVLAEGADPEDPDAAIAAAEHLDIRHLSSDELRAEGVGEAASKVAAIPKVRALLLNFQRVFANDGNGAVLDGRDIGTVVCPDSDAKLYVTASATTRAQRRYEEMRRNGCRTSYEEMLSDIHRRDERDSSRASAPLQKAADAHLIDTSEMDIETAFRAAVDIVDSIRNT
ncbi:MAG: (d)CMP kinase [Stappiaceae bacterium]